MPDYLPTLAEAPVAAAIPGELERRQRERIAAALMAQGGSGEPIQHWAQGLNRVAQGLVGGYQLGELRRQADAEEARTQGIFDRYRQQAMQGAGMPSQAVPGRVAEEAAPAAVPAPRPAMDPRARGIAALSDPGVMASQPGQNRFLDISTAVPTGYTLPPDRGAKVASTDRVVGDDEGVRLGYYDAPKTAGARPPNQPDVAALTSPTVAGAVPVQTQAIRPQAAAAAPPAAALPPVIRAEMEFGLALMGNRPTRDAGLRVYMQALQKAQPNYGFQVIGDTIFRTNPRDGSITAVQTAPQKPGFHNIKRDGEDVTVVGTPGGPLTLPQIEGAQATPRTITGPRGEQLTVPQGQDPKKFKEHITTITADVMGGKMSETQAKDARFAANMENSERTISGTNLEQQGLSLRGRIQEGSPNLPGTETLGNYLQTKQYQQYRAARDKFITSLLRDESGAAIGTKEFIRYERELFPQPGDDATVVEQKRQARKVAIEGMKQGAGPGYKSPESHAPTAQKGGDPIAEARAAIAAGAPKAKVIERLRQNGIAPPADL